MVRFLIWAEDGAKGWACSNCRWRFPVPTLLSEGDAKSAYDRLAGAKFREHKCEGETVSVAAKPAAPKPESTAEADAAFAERARALIKQGYKPKVAVDLVLHEMEFEQGSGSRMMEKARADAEDFLRRVGKGLI